MARIRSVHPGLWTDEVFVSVSPLARLLAIGIWNECDDQGVFEWKPLQLKMRILAADNTDVSALLAELKQANVVCAFEASGRHYGAVRNFQRYQRPKKPNAVYPFPDELRPYVGWKAADGEPVSSDDGEGSPPVPHQFPTSREKPPQMEDGGGRKKDEGKEEEEPLLISPADASRSASPKKARDRGFRLPADWQPSVEDRAFAASLGLDANAVAAEFCDYWQSASGANALKLSWSGTWRNQCRRSVGRAHLRALGAAVVRGGATGRLAFLADYAPARMAEKDIPFMGSTLEASAQ